MAAPRAWRDITNDDHVTMMCMASFALGYELEEMVQAVPGMPAMAFDCIEASTSRIDFLEYEGLKWNC